MVHLCSTFGWTKDYVLWELSLFDWVLFFDYSKRAEFADQGKTDKEFESESFEDKETKGSESWLTD